jgi:hypothetical protein
MIGIMTISEPIMSMFQFHQHTSNNSMMNHLVMKKTIMLKQYLKSIEMVVIIIGEDTMDLGVVEVKALEGMVVEVNKTNIE